MRALQVITLLVFCGTFASSVAHAVPARDEGSRGEARIAATAGAAALFGVDAGNVLDSDPASAAFAAAANARWTRTELSWAEIEATPGIYAFTNSDSRIQTLLDAGLEPMVYVSDNPTWAANTRCGPIDTNDASKVAAFESFVGAVAARYPQVKTWALYNEVDNAEGAGAGCFGATSKGGMNNNGVKDYKEYAILLAAAWRAVHTANPDAKLVMGSVAYDNFQPPCPSGYPGSCIGGSFNYGFMPDLFEYIKSNPLANGDAYIDGILFNYYDLYGKYWRTVAKGFGIQAKAAAIRNLMQKAEMPTLDLYVSETGEDSNPDWVGLKGQARCLSLLLARGTASNLKAMVWWTYRDHPDNAPPPQNEWKYGLVDQNLQPKPSYRAFKALAAELDGYTFVKNLSNKSKQGFAQVEAYQYTNGARRMYWIASMDSTVIPDKPECSWPRTNRLASFHASTLRVVTYLGAVKTIQDNSKQDHDKRSGVIAIKVGGDPKLVEPDPP